MDIIAVNIESTIDIIKPAIARPFRGLHIPIIEKIKPKRPKKHKNGVQQVKSPIRAKINPVRPIPLNGSSSSSSESGITGDGVGVGLGYELVYELTPVKYVCHGSVLLPILIISERFRRTSPARLTPFMYVPFDEFKSISLKLPISSCIIWQCVRDTFSSLTTTSFLELRPIFIIFIINCFIN